MIERITLFKLVDSSAREQVAKLALQALSQLSGMSALSVGLPADPASAKSWDLSVVMRFDELADHDALLASAPFRAWLEGDMAGRYAVVKAWSFASQK